MFGNGISMTNEIMRRLHGTFKLEKPK